MRIRMIVTGEIIEAEDSWGERLIEQGKAVPAAPKPAKPKAETTVTDRVPDSAPKAGTAKKAGKKR